MVHTDLLAKFRHDPLIHQTRHLYNGKRDDGIHRYRCNGAGGFPHGPIQRICGTAGGNGKVERLARRCDEEDTAREHVGFAVAAGDVGVVGVAETECWAGRWFL